MRINLERDHTSAEFSIVHGLLTGWRPSAGNGLEMNDVLKLTPAVL